MTVPFIAGLPAIRTVGGLIDLDRGRQLADGEVLIRLPELDRHNIVAKQRGQMGDPGVRWRVAISSTNPLLVALPIGTKLVWAVFAAGDVRAPAKDGKTIATFDVPTNTVIEFFPADDGIALSRTDGLSLKVEPPWESVTLTKTGAMAWSASGDFAPA